METYIIKSGNDEIGKVSMPGSPTRNEIYTKAKQVAEGWDWVTLCIYNVEDCECAFGEIHK